MLSFCSAFPSFSLFCTIFSFLLSPYLLFTYYQILKLYAWEPSFQTQVENIRGDELKVMRKFAYLTSVSTFIFSCAPALVRLWKILAVIQMQHVFLFLTLSFSLGFTGNVCSVCSGKPGQHLDSWEGFHFHLSFQHPPISLGYAAHAHWRHGASKGSTSHNTWMNTKLGIKPH